MIFVFVLQSGIVAVEGSFNFPTFNGFLVNVPAIVKLFFGIIEVFRLDIVPVILRVELAHSVISSAVFVGLRNRCAFPGSILLFESENEINVVTGDLRGIMDEFVLIVTGSNFMPHLSIYSLGWLRNCYFPSQA